MIKLYMCSGKDIALTSITEGEGNRLSRMLQNSLTHSFIGNGDPLLSVRETVAALNTKNEKNEYKLGLHIMSTIHCIHFLQDEKFDLVAAIKSASYYRRGSTIDYITDFLPPTLSEFKSVCEPFR